MFSLNIESVEFDQLEQLIINHCRTVQMLRLTLAYKMNQAYMNANKWQQLIISHISN